MLFARELTTCCLLHEKNKDMHTEAHKIYKYIDQYNIN